MILTNINKNWMFFPGKFDLFDYKNNCSSDKRYRNVNLPHDFMIEGDVSADSINGSSTGFYDGGIASYTKEIIISKDYDDERIYLYFDGVMGHASVDINGSFVLTHHYGYTPFYADITDYIDYDEANKITVNVNANMQPSSRWYPGAGIYRDVTLIKCPKIHIGVDSIFCHTDRIFNNNAFTTTEVEVFNHTNKKKIVEVEVSFALKNDPDNEVVSRKTSISIPPNSSTVARVPVTINNPVLWDADDPELYIVNVTTKEKGTFTTTVIPSEDPVIDCSSTVFGIRTISVDSTNGLLINEKPVKLKGGCIHHDNGIIGAVALFDADYRKLRIHKENGFNAIRSAHNPPSASLLRACDELGIYVINEAFDSFEHGKMSGDYSQFFEMCWKNDMESFIKRDRNHPSIIMWSTGNEIWERGGIGHGFEYALALSDFVRTLDSSRPVTNGFCDLWSGLCDKEQLDNPKEKDPGFVEDRSEPFVSNLDLVGYNYMDQFYARTKEVYPERVIVGTESFPRFFDTIWANVMANDNVIGDFTWTSYDYLGEAGLGKSTFYHEGNEEEKKKAEYEMASWASPFPWRLSKDADFDLNGIMQPQGYYRKVIWGDKGTYLFTSHPDKYDFVEHVSYWGFDYIYPCYTYDGFEGNMLKVHIFTSAPCIELYQNGKLIKKQEVNADTHYKAIIDIAYEPGELLAISYDENGNEISRNSLNTTKTAEKIILNTDKTTLQADGSSLAFIDCMIADSDDNLVYLSELPMEISIDGPGFVQGFGSANPITTENYTKCKFTTYQGRVMAVIRAGYEKGSLHVTVRTPSLPPASIDIEII